MSLQTGLPIQNSSRFFFLDPEVLFCHLHGDLEPGCLVYLCTKKERVHLTDHFQQITSFYLKIFCSYFCVSPLFSTYKLF